MNRIPEMERLLRDRTLTGIRIDLLRGLVDLDLTEPNEEMTAVTLTGVTGIDWFDDSLNEFCISHVKCLSDSERTILVLDPYDERVDDVCRKTIWSFTLLPLKSRPSKLPGIVPTRRSCNGRTITNSCER